ncbi:glycerophosphodiester phosphodiesterase [Paenibacillus sp. ACRRX]|uniref:glycerophosphodiester phosphodiesterase n=1 Tax=unclassified Paenibacillus TaxID=185978 RepID=UPI001EF5AA61|nr:MULTISPECIES: glycerophosphodiester phosphodiesterase [unclassified Paenibacillus]MCG7409087.1 glycerophosphodiester phosphodiesterase [Paenibacillus sp. ACRRX]MDK8181913.1 glycerophosphodiester phosphodiesterase [Paenibacillus sp. UMB4589-SE434]
MARLSNKNKRPRFQMTRELFRVWKHAGRSFILFELAYKLLTIGLFVPFLSILFNKILDLGGFQAAANHDLLRFVFSRYGLLSLIVLAPLAFIIIYTEFAVLTYIAYYGIQGQRARIRAVLLQVISRLPRLLGIGSIGAAGYLLLLFPLLDIGFGASLLPSIRVPNFVTGELMKSLWGLAVLGVFLTVVVLFNLLCMYALPILVLERNGRFWTTFKKSSRMFWRSKWTLLLTTLEWLVFGIIGIIIVFLLLIGIIVLLSLISEDWANELAFGFVISVGVYALSLVWTPLFMTNLTCLYVKFANPYDIDVHIDGLDAAQWERRNVQNRTFIHRHRRKFATFSMLLLLTVGWGITATLTDWGETKDDFVIMAHRGDVRSGVENTSGAFEGAIRADADYIELDILQTKDEKLAVIHDTNLKRLSGRNVNVYDLTLAELQKATLKQDGYVDRISSLDEVIEQTKGRIKLNIELKTHGQETSTYAATVVDTLRRHKIESEVILQSLDYDLVLQLKALNPQLKVGYLIFATFADLNRFQCDFFVVEESFVNARRIASAKLAHKPIYVWTVNDVESVEHFYTLGVDGIITDIAAEARDQINLLKQPGDRLTTQTIDIGQ